MTAQATARRSDDDSRKAVRFCTAALGEPVIRIERPGARKQPTFRMFLPSGPVIVSRREEARRAELEANVLRALAAQGAPAPRVLAFDGTWLIQEDLGRRRLSQALTGASDHAVERWLGAALESLASIHAAGRAEGLERRVARIGARAGWTDNLVMAPARLGDRLRAPPPTLPHERIYTLMRSDNGTLIKWDARPGNAAAREDGTVAWFDWEHCGCRNALDDIAWLLGDEYVPDLPKAEARLWNEHLPNFAARPDATAYLGGFGALHMCIRLELILKTKGDGPWWPAERCLATDRVGVTPEAAARTCRRAARWAGRCDLTAPLEPWLLSLPALIGLGDEFSRELPPHLDDRNPDR